jgi:hypothetical protein
VSRRDADATINVCRDLHDRVLLDQVGKNGVAYRLRPSHGRSVVVLLPAAAWRKVEEQPGSIHISSPTLLPASTAPTATRLGRSGANGAALRGGMLRQVKAGDRKW